MKTGTPVKIFLLLILLLPAYAAAAGLGELRLSDIEGDVQIRTAETDEWSPAVINFPLRDGDQLWVPEDGLAEIESRRGSIIRLDESSALDILAVDNDALQFYLDMGHAYVNARGARGTTLQLDTPNSSIRVYERAKFSADVLDDDQTDISVFQGSVEAESRRGETTVRAGTMLSLGRHYADLSPLGRPDAWERWNRDQDKAVEGRRRSERYLPEELAGYSRDFDDNGEWVNLPSYGYVWRPSIQIEIGWSPYRNGRWVWIGDDYVWIARESWGWAPYHYGRWSFAPRHGWFWVPPPRHEVYWGPGYVGWVRTPTYVAWVPLAPREVYYGHGYYGPNSVDTRKINVNQVNIKIVYQNVHVNNSVTTVHNDTFIRGREVDFKVKGNPFLKEKISVGQPRIKPERATRIPSLREIPQARRPPERVRENRVEELQKQRHLVKKKDRSVFLPEKKPQALTIEEKKEPKARAPRKTKVTASESRKTEPQKREDARTAPAEQESVQKDRREERQRGQAEVKKDEQSIRDERGRQAPPQRATKSGTQTEDARTAPAEQVSPPADRREDRQRGQAEVKKDEQSTRGREGIRQEKQSTRPRVSTEKVQPTPAGTKEGTRDEGPTLTPEQQKKVKKQHPSEKEKSSLKYEEGSTVEGEAVSPEENEKIYRDRYKK